MFTARSARTGTNRNREWYLNGKIHREDGPAIECADGSKKWYLNGKRHRIDGPAVEYASGLKLWYIDDVEYTQKAFKKHVASIKP